MRRALAFLPLVLLTALSGCGAGTVTLGGKVAYRGRPVTSGSIIVVNEDGTARVGVIEPDGTYSVEGVKRGRALIGVLSPDPAHARSILTPDANHAKEARKHVKNGAKAAKPKAAGWFPLPHELGDPNKSGLTCDVTSSRVEHDIEMK
jgi:hypothetical protein